VKQYLNLIVRISPKLGGDYDVRVSSDQGTGSSTLVLPFALKDIAGALGRPTRGTRGARDVGFDAGEVAVGTAQDLEEIGARLFDALFQNAARDVLSSTESQARRMVETGVRIRLTMNLRDPGMAEVANLPWELMCRSRDDDPLVISTRTAVVRSLDAQHSIDPDPMDGPFRILAIRSNPEGSGPLGLRRETDTLAALWHELGVQVDYVRPVQGQILRQLAAEQYHVVHFMGHGDFKAEEGGMLLLETEDGGPQLVSGRMFAAWLKDEPLRLVFLNACKTGATAPRTDAHPFAGVATSLIANGVPAVVAMQFPISDEGAIAFARTFYERVTQKFPVDAAVAEGRKMLLGLDPPEWATPVLYMRAKDGNLFDTVGGAPRPPPAPVAATRVAAAPEPLMVATAKPEAAAISATYVPPYRRRPIQIIAAVVVAAIAAVAIYFVVQHGKEDAAADVDPVAYGKVVANDAFAADPTLRDAVEALGAIVDDDWVTAADPCELAKKVPAGAHEHLQTLAEKGDARAQFILGCNSSTDQDAFKWVKAAADQKLPVAEFEIGLAYEQGAWGTPKDTQAALNAYNAAVTHGNTTAKQNYDTLAATIAAAPAANAAATPATDAAATPPADAAATPAPEAGH
jgi:hypothetical protein